MALLILTCSQSLGGLFLAGVHLTIIIWQPIIAPLITINNLLLLILLVVLKRIEAEVEATRVIANHELKERSLGNVLLLLNGNYIAHPSADKFLLVRMMDDWSLLWLPCWLLTCILVVGAITTDNESQAEQGEG